MKLNNEIVIAIFNIMSVVNDNYMNDLDEYDATQALEDCFVDIAKITNTTEEYSKYIDMLCDMFGENKFINYSDFNNTYEKLFSILTDNQFTDYKEFYHKYKYIIERI